ncbi:MAG: hypothetical protein GSR86_07805 [Desulfurococcales archaeon]|nr:hypothetical protein [Desulfurococcales archaeon]
MRIKDISISDVGRKLCEAWNLGLTISEIPSILGISRPTFYKILAKYFNTYNMTLRYLPHINNIGYEILIVYSDKLINRSSTYNAIDMNNLSRIFILYTKSRIANTVIEILRSLGLGVDGPYKLYEVLCHPHCRNTIRIMERRIRLAREELRIIRILSRRFINTRVMGGELGISWQKVSMLLSRLRSKEAIASIIMHSKGGKPMYTGVIVKVSQAPSLYTVKSIARESSIIVLQKSSGNREYVLITETDSSSILSMIDYMREDGIDVLRVALSRSYPLPPFDYPHLLDNIDGLGRNMASLVVGPRIHPSFLERSRQP